MSTTEEDNLDYLIVEFDPTTLKIVSRYVYNQDSLSAATEKLKDKLDFGKFNTDPIQLTVLWPSYVPKGLLVHKGCPTRFLMVGGRGLERMQQAIEHCLSTYSSDPLSIDEARERFLEKVCSLVEYWSKIEPDDRSVRDRLSGLAFSILSTLDGSSIDLPGCRLIPMGTEEDKDYLDRQGERHYRVTDQLDLDDYDIGGSLHELFHRAEEAYLAKLAESKTLKEKKDYAV